MRQVRGIPFLHRENAVERLLFGLVRQAPRRDRPRGGVSAWVLLLTWPDKAFQPRRLSSKKCNGQLAPPKKMEFYRVLWFLTGFYDSLGPFFNGHFLRFFTVFYDAL